MHHPWQTAIRCPLQHNHSAAFSGASILEIRRFGSHEELENDGRKILDLLKRPDAPKLGDRTDPEQIRALLGLSKKAFKRAVGRLLKQRLVAIDDQSHLLRVLAP